jgi:3',5'-cyclic AMP phosphodiesterase CpdA
MHRVRILHVSDLHERVALDSAPETRKAKIRLQEAQRYRVLGPKLVEVLKEIRAAGAIDLVCFTGDVADWGLPEEYAAATGRVNDIRNAVGAPLPRDWPKQFFLVDSRKKARSGGDEPGDEGGEGAPA